MNRLVDTHAHVFLRALPMSARRRYTPEADAPLEAYLDLLDRHGVRHGVLVQPSFLGNDNRFLLQCLRRTPTRLRGVAVVTPEISDIELDRYREAGVVGIRYNLLGEDPDLMASGPWRDLSRRVAELGWHIEIQSGGRDWLAVLGALDGIDAPIVADHFGRPDPVFGPLCSGFQALLAEGPEGRIHVKLSAPYRCGGNDVQIYRDALYDRLGSGRLLWGSDWPWTQHGHGKSFAALMAGAASSRTEADIACCAGTAHRLYGFGLP